MEITFKFIIDKIHPKKDLTLPVRLRLYFNRDFKQQSLGFAVLQKDWDEQLQHVLPSNPDHLTYNTKIASVRSKIQKFLLLNEDKEGQVTPQKIIDHLTQRLEKVVSKTKPDILAYGTDPRPNSNNPEFIANWLKEGDPNFPDYFGVAEAWEKGEKYTKKADK